MKEKKKVNTFVFMVAATLLNLLLILAFFLIFSSILTFTASRVEISDSLYTILAALVIILSFILSFLVYKKIIVWASGKWDFGKGKERE